MDTGLAGRSALVTGGTRGIGRAIALAYAGEGARVAITYASEDAAASETVATLNAHGKGSASFYLNLEDNASIEAAVEGAVAAFGGLDVLVASAVRWPVDARAPLAGVDHTDWTRALRASLEGIALTARAALPHLARSTAWRIVLISSGVSRHGMAGATAYSTAKAALDRLLAFLKWEAGAAGVLVNIVSLGFTVTENNLAQLQRRRSRVRPRENTVGAPLSSRRCRQRGRPAGIPGERQHHRRIPPGRRWDRLSHTDRRRHTADNASMPVRVCTRASRDQSRD